MLLTTTSAQNNGNGGNGGYIPFGLTVRQSPNEEAFLDVDIKDLNALNDKRMRFKNSRDPIYVAFDHLQKQSMKRLAKDFVKDLINEGISYISFK